MSKTFHNMLFASAFFFFSLAVSLVELHANDKTVEKNDFIPLYYWVSFTDKSGSPYSINEPQAFLSNRALERRARQGIALNDVDLPVNQRYIDSLSADANISVFYASRWLNGVLIKTSNQPALERIGRFPFVSHIEYVKPAPPASKKTHDKFEFEATGTVIPNQYMDASDFVYSRIFTEQLNGQYLHDHGFYGNGKLIAVLDAGYTGVNNLEAFSNLRDRNQIVAIRDFVDPLQNIYASHLHGTYVLSVMGAYLPGLISGTAREADFMLIRTEDGSSEFRIEEYNWLAGAELADSAGADIINSSLGYTQFNDPSQNYIQSQLDGKTSIVSRAANKAFERGILVVNSAGNYATQSWIYVGSPADSFGALSIGAVAADSLRTDFSSIGPTADGRIKPDVMALGRNLVVAGPENKLYQVSATSFSTPVITGLAACLWQKHPELSASEIKDVIIASGNQALNPDNFYGHGLPDFEKASAIARTVRVIDVFKHYKADIYPNPLQTNSIIKFHTTHPSTIAINIYNNLGQLITNIPSVKVEEGPNYIQPFDNFYMLNPGTYFIQLSNKDFQLTLRAVLLK